MIYHTYIHILYIINIYTHIMCICILYVYIYIYVQSIYSWSITSSWLRHFVHSSLSMSGLAQASGDFSTAIREKRLCTTSRNLGSTGSTVEPREFPRNMLCSTVGWSINTCKYDYNHNLKGYSCRHLLSWVSFNNPSTLGILREDAASVVKEIKGHSAHFGSLQWLAQKQTTILMHNNSGIIYDNIW